MNLDPRTMNKVATRMNLESDKNSRAIQKAAKQNIMPNNTPETRIVVSTERPVRSAKSAMKNGVPEG
jgi:hypothetical protein